VDAFALARVGSRLLRTLQSRGTPLTVNNINMFKEKKYRFQPLDRQSVAFKTLEHSISYNPSHRLGEKRGKCDFRNPNTVCLQQHKSLMTFKVLL